MTGKEIPHSCLQILGEILVHAERDISMEIEKLLRNQINFFLLIFVQQSSEVKQ
jgi:hypothetical protein